MRKLIKLLAALLILSSCASSTKLMQKGRYDASISKAVKKLSKKPGSSKDAIALDRSYKLANENDMNRIKFLKQEGNPDSWDEILMHFDRLKNRQNMIRPVIPLNINGRTVNYSMVDYDQEIIDAKDNAAEYFYNNARQLMEQGTKDAYRQAYDEFSRAKEYRSGQYADIDDLMEEARYHGISRVLVEINNATELRLPEEFVNNLLQMNTATLESRWVEYYQRDLDQSVSYDYFVFIILEHIEVSPDNVSDNDKMFKKDVEDGFDYKLDDRGNVMKDTAGNDIRIPRYKTLSCAVIESYQQKSVRIEGTVEIQTSNPAKLIKKEVIGAEYFFKHHSARAVGDVDALDEKTRKLVDSKPVPFPTDGEMIYNCSESLKPVIRDAIYRNRRLIY